MSRLTQFTNDEQKLLISVPYRVGVWMSQVDNNTKTSLDDKRERQALIHAMERMAKAHKKMPFAAQVMSEVVKSKVQWLNWMQTADEATVLSDVTRAIEICNQKSSPAEVKQYKQAVWQLGLIVAQAFGEQIDPDNEMHVDRFFSWLGSFFGPPKLKKAPENMSKVEKIALKKLRAVLKN